MSWVQYGFRVLPPRTKPRTSLPHMTGQSLPALPPRFQSYGAYLANSLTCGRAQLAMQHGGLGLRSAAGHAHPAYVRSSRRATRGCGLPLRSNCTCGLHVALPHSLADRNLATTGFAAPSWSQLARRSPSRGDRKDDEPADLTRGRQWSASRAVDQASAAAYTQRFDDPSRALLKSQSGPFAAKVLTASPISARQSSGSRRPPSVCVAPLLAGTTASDLVLAPRRLDAFWRPLCILTPLWLVTAPGHPARKSSNPCLPRGGSDAQHQRPPA